MTRATRVWPVFLLLAAMIPATGAQITGSLPDLEVEHVRIIGPDPMWTDDQATDTRISVTVRNNGGAPSVEGYTITYEWLDGNQARPLNGERQNSIDIHPALGESILLETGKNRTHEIDWNLQPDQRGDVPIRVTIQPLGANGRTNNDEAVHNVFVPDRHVILEPLDSETNMPIRAHETQFVRIPVTNLGNEDQIVGINVTANDEGETEKLVATLIPSDAAMTGLLVSAGETVTATLFVNYNFLGEKDPDFSISYDIDVDTGYGSSVQDTTPTFTYSDDDMTAGSPATMEYLGPVPLMADPGGDVDALLRITNTGNGSDTYSVSALFQQAGWDAAVDLPKIGLDAGETQIIKAKASAPSQENAVLGSHATMTASFLSDRDAVLQIPSTHLPVPLRLHGPSITVTPGDGWPEEPYAGEPEIYPVLISNDGDEETLPNGTVTLTITDPDGTTTQIVQVVNDTIAPGLRGQKTLTFDLNETFPDQGGILRATAEWTSAQDRSIATKDLATEMLLHDPDIAIDPPTPLAGMAGEMVGYRTSGHVFLVHNNGDAPETLRISIQASAGNVNLALDNDTILIGPGDARSIPFDHHLPESVGNMTDDMVTLQANIVGRDALTWDAQVATSILDSVPPTITSAGTWPSEWTLGTDLPIRVNVTDDSTIQEVNVTHTDPSGQQSNHTMSPVGSDQWGLSLPLDVIGNHTFTIHAEDIYGNTADLTLPDVSVAAIPPPTVSLTFNGNTSAVNASEPFQVVVADERNVTADLIIEWTDNSTTVLQKPLPLSSAGHASFDLADVPPGNLTISVHATNDAGAAASESLAIVLSGPAEASSSDDDSTDTQDTDTPRGIPAPALWAVIAFLIPAAKHHRRRESRPPRPNHIRLLWYRIRSAPLWTRVGAVAAVTILVAGTVLAAIGPMDLDLQRHANSEAPDRGSLAEDLDQFWANLPESMDPVTAMGPAARYLFEAGPDGPRLTNAPESASDLMGRIVDPGTDRLPVPSPPPGDEPLLTAVQALLEPPAIEGPGPDVLRTHIAALRLGTEAERGLAQLVLAYKEALRLEEGAMSGLTPHEQQLVAGDIHAWDAWYAEDSTRSNGDGDAFMQELRGRIDTQALLQATDLLTRTAEEVKDVISLPPEPIHAPAHTTTIDLRAGALSSTLHPEDDSDSHWGMLKQIVTATSLQPPSDLPELPDEDLATALQHLATTLGVPASQTQAVTSSVDLPPSLADAIAGIVTARWVGFESGDAHTHTLLLLDAMERAEPALRAWAAVLSMEVDVSAPDAEGLLRASLTPGASPSMFMQGAGPDGSGSVTPLLTDLLTGYGLTPSEAVQATENLPVQVAAAVATALTGLDALEEAHRMHLPAIETARDQSLQISGLLLASTWTPDEAARVQEWAEGRQAGLDAERAVAQARTDAVRAVESAVAMLEEHVTGVPMTDAAHGSFLDAAPEEPSWVQSLFAFITDFQIIGTASAQPLPVSTPCVPSPFSDCDADVLFYFYTSASGGLLVTGSGQTTIGHSSTGEFTYAEPPRLIIDLGGDDTYLVPAGTASSAQRTSVVIDLGGDDHYRSDSSHAHGVGDGPGTLGILWDLAGDDHYEHLGASSPGVENLGQGVGRNGGMGILVDGSGTDRYEAPRSMAHGVTVQSDPSNAFSASPTMGLLLDQGPGDDRFTAKTGQGHGGASLGTAVLLNEDGASRYETLLGNPMFQGGIGTGVNGATALLIDLGGDGTAYSNSLPEEKETVTVRYFSNDTQSPERRDDSAWIIAISATLDSEITAPGGAVGDLLNNPSFGSIGIVRDEDDDSIVINSPLPGSFAIGIDSTPRDEDGNGVPDIVELLVGGVAQTVQDLAIVPDVDPERPFPFTYNPFEFYRPHPIDGCERDEGDRPEFALLHITGPTDDIIDTPASILIDLGGNDTYTNEVAGPGRFCFPEAVGVNDPRDNDQNMGQIGSAGGSIAWDLDGDDHYDTPKMKYTQAAIDSGGLERDDPDDSIIWDLVPGLVPVSLLLETGGHDTYRADAYSQGAADGLGFGGIEANTLGIEGAAWLMDTTGDDTYISNEKSQAYAHGASGLAALIELAGDDTYEFETQGVIGLHERTFVGMALFLDREGTDHYRSNLLLSDESTTDRSDLLLDDIITDDDPAFHDQGRVDFGTFACTHQADGCFPLAVFVDEGPQTDTYERLIQGGALKVYTDLSDTKNDRVKVSSTKVGTTDLPSGFRGIFSDGAACAEAGFCTDTGNIDFGDGDGDGVPTFIEFLFGTNATDPNDHPGALWGDPTRIDGPELWLDIRGTGGLVDIGRGGLAIGGHGDNAYTKGPYDFLVDLGGSDLYNFTDVGNGMFLLDAGRNDTDVDIYEPAGTGPSLGAPNGTGIAVLLDNGGVNRFRSAGNVTQGAAAAPGGVGVLVTWNASNHFISEGGAPSAPVSAVQGAGVDGGVGVLASFGNGDDLYRVSKHVPWAVDFPIAAQGAANGPGSVGLLLDGGGRNEYFAPDAVTAQGAASGTGAVGILWAGDGNDLYTAGDRSQASSQEGGVGVLFEPGGDDVYRAGSNVQGASDGGVSLLIDLGGYDAYHATDQAQGHATDDGIAFLIDLHGDDNYRMDTNAQEGQGYGCGALLLDGDGQDHYSAGHARNDDSWIEPESSNCAFQTGIDAAQLEDAFDRLARLASSKEPTLEMEVDGEALGSFKSTDDRRDLVLRTRISEMGGPEDVRRVTYFIDDERFAEGAYVGTEQTEQGDDLLVYEHRTTITHSRLPDGNHEVVAVVVPETTPGADPAVGTADLPARQSTTLTLRVDSAPEPEITLSSRYTSNTSASMLTIDLDRDANPSHRTPGANETVAGCKNNNAEAGGYVKVTAIHQADASDQHTLFDGYCHAGPFTLDIRQSALDDDWQEGVYDIVVEVTDQSDDKDSSHLDPPVRFVHPNQTVHLDLQAPTSWISVDYVGTPHLNEAGELILVPWNSSDTDGGSGIADVFIVQVDGQGNPLQSFGPLNQSGLLPFEVQSTFQVIDLVTIAVDNATNIESCDTSKTTSCFQQRLDQDDAHRVIVDLQPPTVLDLTASTQVVHPDDNITYTVHASEQNPQGHQSIDKVLLHIDGGEGLPMTPVGGGLYSLTMKHGDTYADREVTYEYRAVAHDKAGNTASTFPESGTIDGRAPRITPISITYTDPSNEKGLAGVPGGTATFLLDVRDQNEVTNVSLNITALNRSQSDQIHDCAPSPDQVAGLWECHVPLASDVVDGVYQVPIRAEDTLGNANTDQTVEMVISTANLPITDLQITDIDHQGFTLHWTTNASSTSAVQHSLNTWLAGEDPSGNPWPPEDGGVPDSWDLSKNHTVRIDNLQPANTYHYRAVSQSGSGVYSNSIIRQVDLPNSYTFDLWDFGPDAALGGKIPVQYNLTLLDGTQPVDVQMFLQDTETNGAQRQAVTHRSPQGEATNATTWIDTRARQPDGTLLFDSTYRLIVELERSGADRMTVTSEEFRLDNQEPILRPEHPLPGATTNTTWPDVRVFLQDPEGVAPSSDDLTLRVDGNAIAFEVAGDTLIDDTTRHVTLAPLADQTPLGHGTHTYNVSVSDRAGNQGWVEWQVVVDARPPTIRENATITMDPGPDRARPGGSLTVTAHLIDDTSVAQAWLDLTPIGGETHAMVSTGNGQWTVGIDLPADAPEGTHEVSIEAKDGLDNQGPAATINITIDATPPSVTAEAVSASYTNATIDVHTDEPARVRADNGTWTGWGDVHTVTVDGLSPGTSHTVTVAAIDLAGHTTTTDIQVETVQDTSPPTAPANLTAESTTEGVVSLNWTPASDNAGVTHYVVTRSAADRAQASQANTTGTAYVDDGAPAGRSVTYQVHAVDAAGLAGPTVEATLTVHAIPRLINGSISPEQGASTTPFHLQVDYVHPSGEPADQVHVRVGDLQQELALIGNASSCHVACKYAADVLLPPTSQVVASKDVRFTATHAGQTAELVVAAPLVTGGHVTVHDDTETVDTPSPGFLLSALLILGLAAASRSLLDRRRPRP